MEFFKKVPEGNLTVCFFYEAKSSEAETRSVIDLGVGVSGTPRRQ